MYLFLSPHYDDAVLSCGGLIHQLMAAGQTGRGTHGHGREASTSRMPNTPIIPRTA